MPIAPLNLFALDGDTLIIGDQAAARTITLGQTGPSFDDIIVVDSADWSVDGSGVASFAALQIGNGDNTHMGLGALAAITSGTSNVVLGNGAGDNLNTGGTNVLIGDNAGDVLTDGSGNVLIGTNVDATGASTSNELRIHNTSGVPLISGDMALGLLGVNTLTERTATLNVETDASDAVDCLALVQNDDSENMIRLVATSAASTVNPLTTFTTGNSIQGFFRVDINGTARWIPIYDAPTS